MERMGIHQSCIEFDPIVAEGDKVHVMSVGSLGERRVDGLNLAG